MNHQPFEDWLLDDEPLSHQQEHQLQSHLRTCTSCARIADANLTLHARRMAAPAPGFTARFGPRLAAWRREQLRRQAVGTVILVAAGIALLYAVAGPAMMGAVRSPASWLTDVTGYLIMISTALSVAEKVGGILFRSLAAVVPPAGWGGLWLAVCMLCVLWIISMRRLARAPQGA
jgi:hypothetical protein